MASTAERSPTMNRSNSAVSIPAAWPICSQKRARTSEVTISSCGLSSLIAASARSETQRRITVTPTIASAWRNESTR